MSIDKINSTGETMRQTMRVSFEFSSITSGHGAIRERIAAKVRNKDNRALVNDARDLSQLTSADCQSLISNPVKMSIFFIGAS